MTIKLLNGLDIWMFPLGDVDRWTSVKIEIDACMVLYHLFSEQVREMGTPLMERGCLALFIHTFCGKPRIQINMLKPDCPSFLIMDHLLMVSFVYSTLSINQLQQ